MLKKIHDKFLWSFKKKNNQYPDLTPSNSDLIGLYYFFLKFPKGFSCPSRAENL